MYRTVIPGPVPVFPVNAPQQSEDASVHQSDTNRTPIGPQTTGSTLSLPPPLLSPPLRVRQHTNLFANHWYNQAYVIIPWYHPHWTTGGTYHIPVYVITRLGQWYYPPWGRVRIPICLQTITPIVVSPPLDWGSFHCPLSTVTLYTTPPPPHLLYTTQGDNFSIGQQWYHRGWYIYYCRTSATVRYRLPALPENGWQTSKQASCQRYVQNAWLYKCWNSNPNQPNQPLCTRLGP